MEHNTAALDDGDIAHNAKVVELGGIFEEDGVLALDDEAGNVEGSKVEHSVLVGLEVSSTSKVVEAGRNVRDRLAVDDHVQLANPVVKVVHVESGERQQHRLTG